MDRQRDRRRERQTHADREKERETHRKTERKALCRQCGVKHRYDNLWRQGYREEIKLISYELDVSI